MGNTKSKQEEKQKVSVQQGLKTYFKGVKAEWGKVSWPQKNQITIDTITVLIVTVCFTILVFCVDKIFEFILSFIR
jgi:preprotein translocase subunit SecE